MKNCNGFTLVETMIALLLFSITVMAIIPALVTVQEERQAIRTERFVEAKLNEYYERAFIVEEQIDEFFQRGSIQFHALSSKKDGINQFCISWEGGNERYYERCLSKR